MYRSALSFMSFLALFLSMLTYSMEDDPSSLDNWNSHAPTDTFLNNVNNQRHANFRRNNANGLDVPVLVAGSSNNHRINTTDVTNYHYTQLNEIHTSGERGLYPLYLSNESNTRAHYRNDSSESGQIDLSHYIEELDHAIKTHDIEQIGCLVFSPDVQRLSLEQIIDHKTRIANLSYGLLNLREVRDLGSAPHSEAGLKTGEDDCGNCLKKTALAGLFSCGLIGLTGPVFYALFPNACGIFSQLCSAGAGCAGGYCVQCAQTGNNNLARMEIAAIEERLSRRIAALEQTSEQFFLKSIECYLTMLEQQKNLERMARKEK